jgi:hypothetical protein
MAANVGEVITNGFYINDARINMEDMALMSLRLALKAYCSTYSSISYCYNNYKDGTIKPVSDKAAFNHTLDYSEQYVETIIHFHHYFELGLKRILRREHPLLAVESNDKHELYYKLVKGEVISEDEHASLFTIEFSRTLQRLKPAIQAQVAAGEKKYEWILAECSVLEKLNKLRNRIWHRGTFILTYNALDVFIGAHILPAALRLAADEFPIENFRWRPEPLACKVEPFNAIVDEFKKYPYNVAKVSYLKEMGRAAYINPLLSLNAEFDLDNPYHITKAKKVAEVEHSYMGKSQILPCPVCGVEAFVVFSVFEDEAYDTERGKQVAIEVAVEAECTCCTFKVRDDLGDPSEHGLPIPNLWTYEVFG